MDDSVSHLLGLTMRFLGLILIGFFHHNWEVFLPVGSEIFQGEASLEFDSAQVCAAFFPQRFTILVHCFGVVGDHI